MLTIIPQLVIGATDLMAALLFMYGLKRMSSPVTASSGIMVAGLGMLVAVLAFSSAKIPPTTTMPCTKFEPDISGVCRIAGWVIIGHVPAKAASMKM